MKIRQMQMSFLACVLVLLAGCAPYLEQPTSFNDRAAYLEQGVNAVIAAATVSLRDQVIGSEDAEFTRETVIRARAILGSAEVAFEEGEVDLAQKRLALAEGLLREAKQFLLSKGVQS